MYLIHTTAKGVEIFAEQGRKSNNDFVVRYRQPGKRVRTPQHIHMIVDLYQKRGGDEALTADFAGHVVENICRKVIPSTGNPPALRLYRPEHVVKYAGLEGLGEYSVEFLLVTLELIQTQEITNYPNGRGHYALYERFRSGADIFSVVSAATYRGR